MFPRISPLEFKQHPAPIATGDDAAIGDHQDRPYRDVLRSVVATGIPRIVDDRGQDLLGRWQRTPRRYRWNLDRWRPALDRFRETARGGGIVCSWDDDREPELRAFSWMTRVVELNCRRLNGAKRHDWAGELLLDGLRATSDLRANADGVQLRWAIECEMHLMRELRRTFEYRRVAPDVLRRLLDQFSDRLALTMSREECYRAEYLRRSESQWVAADTPDVPPREHLRRAIYRCLLQQPEPSFDDDGAPFEVVERSVAVRFPESFCVQHQIADTDQWQALIDPPLRSEIVELYRMRQRMDARDVAAGATFAHLCVATYYRQLGFYPESLSSACGEFRQPVPRDAFDAESRPLRMRAGGGELLRGPGVDNLKKRVATRLRQPLIYSIGPDGQDDGAGRIWDGTEEGGGDWVFPLPAQRRPRHWKQFDLRKAMLLMTVAAIFLAYFSSPAARQRRAVSLIEATGGSVTYYDPDPIHWRAKFQSWLGAERFGVPSMVSIGVGAPVGDVLMKMKGFDEITSIDLDQCVIESGDLVHLRRFRKLNSVYLDNADMPSSEFQELGHLPELTHLRCGDEGIDDERFSQIPALPKLQSLTLSHTQLSGKTFTRLAEKFPRLRELILYDTNCDDAALVEIGKLKELSYLDLDGTPITDAGIAHLRLLTKMETLDLQRTQLTDASLPHLAKMTRLKQLWLNETRVTGSGLVHLAKLKSLSEISMDSTPITDRELPILAQLSSLQSISLDGTRVTPQGAQKLKGLTNTNISFPDWNAAWYYDKSLSSRVPPAPQSPPPLPATPLDPPPRPNSDEPPAPQDGNDASADSRTTAAPPE